MPCNAPPLFFDYNATAPLTQDAKTAMLDVMDLAGNPASPHCFGRQMRQKLEEARQVIATTLHAQSLDEIVFNSGGTEGNNTILKTFEALGASLFVSEIEHPCVLKTCASAHSIPVDANGIIDLVWLEQALSTCDTAKPILVSIMLANNETGVIQPLQDIIALAKKYKAYVHSDAVQALCRIPLDLDLYPLDYMTVSGHKIGGCTGFGVLYVRTKAPYIPLLDGGGQEKGKRSGTSNVLGAVAFAAALKKTQIQNWSPIEKIQNFIEEGILNHCPEASIWASTAPRVANTLSIHMPGVPNMTQLMAFDIERIAISSGSACSSGKVAPSHVLSAMGIQPEKALETIRVSMGPHTTQQEADRFLNVWKNIYDRASTTAPSTLLAKGT